MPRFRVKARSDVTPDADSPQHSVYGYLGGVVAGRANGWCWRASEPAERLEVEVVVDGAPVAQGVADRPRADVARAGYGDGRYGFSVPLPDELDDGGSHRIAVRVGEKLLPAVASFVSRPRPPRAADGGEGPDGGRWSATTFVPEEGTRPAALEREASERRPRPRGRRGAEAEAGEVAGYIDGIIGGALVGWVVDKARPRASLRIAATFDGERIGEFDANVARNDLKRQGYGDRHGFRVALPGRLEPGHHSVEVRTVDGRRVPLARDYVVMDARSKAIEGVTLLDAMSSAPPPAAATAREALLGLEGWIFEFAPGDFHVLRGAEPLSDDVVARHLLRLRERHQLARATGAQVVEAVMPARLAVYGEYLPTGLSIEEPGRPAERLLAAVREQNVIDALDLTAALRHAKPHGEVFARTGRSLTWLGGFAAYRAIAKHLARSTPGLEPLKRDELTFAELEPGSDSLAELPRVVWVGSTTVPAGSAAESEAQEGGPRLDWTKMNTEYAVVPPDLAAAAGSAAAMLRRREGGRDTDALVIHDGSAERVAPFLAEHFDRTLVVAGGADVDRLCAMLKPAVIIEIVGEAALLRT
jgi:hypothetical protein